MKSYLLSHGEACTPEHVQRVLNDTREVETWVTPFPYAAILISRLDVRDLATVIRERLPGVWLMVTELNGGAVQGWLPGDLWEYVNDPQKAWSRKLFSGMVPPPAPSPSIDDLLGFASRPRRFGGLGDVASAASRDPDSPTKELPGSHRLAMQPSPPAGCARPTRVLPGSYRLAMRRPVGLPAEVRVGSQARNAAGLRAAVGSADSISSFDEESVHRRRDAMIHSGARDVVEPVLIQIPYESLS